MTTGTEGAAMKMQDVSNYTEFLLWLADHRTPLMGAETPPNDPPDDDDDDVAIDDEDDDEDDDDDDDNDSSDVGKLRSDLAAAQRAAREAKREAREARQAAASDSGNWEQLAKEREAEVNDLREQLEEVTGERDTISSESDSFKRQVRVQTLAGRLHFKDPSDAIAMLSEEQTGDDKSTERALRKLAQQKPYLVDQRKASGRGMGGGNGSGLTMEQIKSMTPEEINARWEEVQNAMAAGG